ncbi:MAG: hypothetical protein HFJ27_00915 [Clostridia bacterium]|nr:hypothetical protein [Clostridia bacterium]
MKERTVATVDDILQYVEEERKASEKTVADIEKGCSIGKGTMSKWKKLGIKPALHTILKVLNFLDIEVVLRSKK